MAEVEKKDVRSGSLSPLTVKQLQNARVQPTSDSHKFFVDDYELDLVKIVGVFEDKTVCKPGCIMLRLNDCTGTICAFVYVADHTGVEDSEARAEEEDTGFATEEKDTEQRKNVAAATPQLDMVPNVYYEVIGRARWMRTARGLPESHVHVDIEHMRRVTDHNNVTHHNLEVIWVHLQRTRGQQCQQFH
jgi:hypothetical protein